MNTELDLLNHQDCSTKIQNWLALTDGELKEWKATDNRAHQTVFRVAKTSLWAAASIPVISWKYRDAFPFTSKEVWLMSATVVTVGLSIILFDFKHFAQTLRFPSDPNKKNCLLYRLKCLKLLQNNKQTKTALIHIQRRPAWTKDDQVLNEVDAFVKKQYTFLYDQISKQTTSYLKSSPAIRHLKISQAYQTLCYITNLFIRTYKIIGPFY